MLSAVKSPEDLKKIPQNQLSILAKEIREKIIEVVGQNGGHLASNLGIVELTIALHRVFNSPSDAIIFDVSHQCYAHKMLTGRYSQFNTLRKRGGISGFTKREESAHDFFDNGHASTSISQAIGLLTAWNLQGKNDKVIAVIGDGALTGGMAFEALSHAGQLAKNLIIVLNDNQMSISANTGSLSKYLSSLTMTGLYQRIRHAIDGFVEKIPMSSHHLGKFIYRFKRGIKGLLLDNNLFTDFGFEYVGPLNGHDISELENVFNRVKKLRRPVVVHIVTKKGKGYSPAENDPAKFHGIGPFLISDGQVENFNTQSFTEVFSNAIVDLAEKNEKIAAVTAAMSKGTGLDSFARHFPSRFFDVGIAEEHAVTFAGGLSRGGLIPIVAIYSTFIQRSIDQIIHDIALPCAHVIICLDRAGVVPDDGETHQGMFDIALLRPVPNVTILSPATANDLRLCLDYAVDRAHSPVIIRYPKLSCQKDSESFSLPIVEGRGVLLKCFEFESSLSAIFKENDDGIFDSDFESANQEKILFVCTGSFLSETVQAARSVLMNDIRADIFVLRFIKPFDTEYFVKIAHSYSAVVIAEDGIKTGGIGNYLQKVLSDSGFENSIVKAFPERFFRQGSREQICEDALMTSRDLAKAAFSLLERQKIKTERFVEAEFGALRIGV